MAIDAQQPVSANRHNPFEQPDGPKEKPKETSDSRLSLLNTESPSQILDQISGLRQQSTPDETLRAFGSLQLIGAGKNESANLADLMARASGRQDGTRGEQGPRVLGQRRDGQGHVTSGKGEPAGEGIIKQHEPALNSIDAGNPPTIGDAAREQGSHRGREQGPPEEKPRTIPHVVQKGDTLWSISKTNQSDNGNISKPSDTFRGVGSILESNPRLNPDKPLIPGQKIQIPEDIRTGFRPDGIARPGAPTGLIIDYFAVKGVGESLDASHGGVLSKGFNAMGFNVLRANVAPGPKLGQGRDDWSPTMERAANYIEANRDKFPPGSFVNTSFGNSAEGKKSFGDPTFADLSKLLKTNITPENIGQQREQILHRLEHIANGRNPESGQPDPKTSPADRKMAEAAVRSNKQIERIQNMGVEVIHSAGNDGPTRVDINFLRATNLRADGPNGKPLGFSAVGSHTEHGAGLYTFHLNPDQKSATTFVHGYGVTVPIDKKVPLNKQDHVVKPENFATNNNPFPPAPKNYQSKFDLDAFKRGYEQRIYNVGPAIALVPGTSFSPFSYVARTRNVPRPYEP